MSEIPHSIHHEWTRSISDGKTNGEKQYLVSTDKSFISIPALIEAFSQEYMYWAKPLPETMMQKMVNGSICLGLYECPSLPVGGAGKRQQRQQQEQETGMATEKDSLKQIGFARLITDDVTFVYLTDVYVLPEYQGSGLGTWMMKCVDELVKGMEHLRRFTLFTKGEQTRKYYEKVIDAETMGDMGNSVYLMTKTGPGNMVRTQN